MLAKEKSKKADYAVGFFVFGLAVIFSGGQFQFWQQENFRNSPDMMATNCQYRFQSRMHTGGMSIACLLPDPSSEHFYPSQRNAR